MIGLTLFVGVVIANFNENKVKKKKRKILFFFLFAAYVEGKKRK